MMGAPGQGLNIDQANYESTATQHAAIREYFLAGGRLTPQTALRQFGCFRLAAVVHVLKRRERLNIVTEMVEGQTPEGKKRWAAYYLGHPRTLGEPETEGRTCK